MDGTLLNFDPAEGTGLIRAGDGKRYSFAAGDWKSPETPAPGDVVDFEVEGDRAAEVYRIRPGAVSFGKKPVPPADSPAPPPAADAPAMPATPPPAGEWTPPQATGDGPGPYLAARPGLVFAGLLLLACFLPFISAGGFISLNLFNLVSITSMAGNFAYGAGGGVQLGLLLFYLLYAVPIMACWLIFQELRGEASAALRRWTGLVGLVGPFAVILLASLLVQSGARSGPFGRGPRGGDLTGSLISSMSFGWILIIAVSLALIAVGMGWSPFGKKDEGD